MSKKQRIKPQCKMKAQFSREKMLLKWVLLLQPLLLQGPLWEMNDSVPLLKRGLEGTGVGAKILSEKCCWAF